MVKSRKEEKLEIIQIETAGSIPVVPERLQNSLAEMIGGLAEMYAEYQSEIYIERHAKKNKRSWKWDRQRMVYLTPLFNRKVNSIKRRDVEALHTEIGKRGRSTANKVIGQLRHMINMAIDWEYLPPHHRNPVRKIQLYKTYPSTEFVHENEMPRLLEVINTYPDRQVADVIKVALLTGLRANEILNLKWHEVNLESKTICLSGRKTKNGLAHYLPITDSLAALFSSIPQRTDTDWVFPGRFKGTRRYHVDDEWQIIRELAGIPKVRFHDLRRTVGSWLIEQTGSLALVGQVLNQTNQHVTKIYSLYDIKNIRRELQAYDDKLKGLGLEEVKAKTVPSIPAKKPRPEGEREEPKKITSKNSVCVRRQHHEQQCGYIEIDCLQNVRWSYTDEQWKISAIVPCTSVSDDNWNHSKLKTPCPHPVKVFLYEKENREDVFTHLKNIADRANYVRTRKRKD